ncbi:MAG TPA: hypothetical protein VJT67_08890 [Longimicrobiaceae bacterium]|nr:hypothetical protein [Longimicrobiaceae bacterium]
MVPLVAQGSLEAAFAAAVVAAVGCAKGRTEARRTAVRIAGWLAYYGVIAVAVGLFCLLDAGFSAAVRPAVPWFMAVATALSVGLGLLNRRLEGRSPPRRGEPG